MAGALLSVHQTETQRPVARGGSGGGTARKSGGCLVYSAKNQHLRSLAWEEHNPFTLGMKEGFTHRVSTVNDHVLLPHQMREAKKSNT